jgi:hypothetical protein
VYAAQTLTGLGCGSLPPRFRVVEATKEPFHTGTVCAQGTTCQAQLIDRRLGDYFTIDIDRTGAMVAAYSDTRKDGAVALPAFIRQSSGPSFRASAAATPGVPETAPKPVVEGTKQERTLPGTGVPGMEAVAFAPIEP